MQSSRLTHKTQQILRYTYPYVFWDDFFSEGELQALEDWCVSKGLSESQVIGQGGYSATTDHRKSKSAIHDFNYENLWIFEKLRLITEHANNEFFNFDLYGFDYFQYAEYQGEGSHYDYHTDLIYGHELPSYMIYPRKLSFSLLMNDPSEYVGGDFEIMSDTNYPFKLEQKKGRVFAFPSWILHKVSPLTTGVRKSIVWWVTGPKFR